MRSSPVSRKIATDGLRSFDETSGISVGERACSSRLFCLTFGVMLAILGLPKYRDVDVHPISRGADGSRSLFLAELGSGLCSRIGESE